MLMIGSTSYNLKMTSTDEDGDNIFEYVQGEQFHVSVRSIYLLTLGEFDLGTEESPLGHSQWALFYVGTFLLQIMMFNLLIAILSDTFAKVMEEIDESD